MISGGNMKNIILNIVKVLIILALFFWVVIVLTDYFRVRQQKDPLFCITKNVKEYSDGEVESCVGLGYKVINYKRKCLGATEFGAFYTKERKCVSE